MNRAAFKQPFRNRTWVKEVQPGHHPLVSWLSDLIEIGGYSGRAVCDAAGVDPDLISNWRLRGTQPTIGNFDAVLNTMGYELCIRRKSNTGDQ
jgi:hypothetical protein